MLAIVSVFAQFKSNLWTLWLWRKDVKCEMSAEQSTDVCLSQLRACNDRCGREDLPRSS